MREEINLQVFKKMNLNLRDHQLKKILVINLMVATNQKHIIYTNKKRKRNPKIKLRWSSDHKRKEQKKKKEQKL